MRPHALLLAVGLAAAGCAAPAKPASVWTMPVTGQPAVGGVGWGAGNASDGVHVVEQETATVPLAERGELPEVTQRRRPGFWRFSEEAVLAEARHMGRGVVLRFTADWCIPCQRMDVETFRDARLRQAIQKQFIPLVVDVTEPSVVNRAQSKRYGVTKLPMILILDSRGREVERIDTYVDADTFRDKLRMAAATLSRDHAHAGR